MEQIKAFIFREDNGDKTITVIMEDGGVASAYNPDDYYRTDYYQDRITQETTLDDMWDELGEGKMYTKDWDGNEDENLLIDKPITEENFVTLVDDMIGWLYCSTEKFEIVKIEMGELTEETFEQVKQQLNLEEE